MNMEEASTKHLNEYGEAGLRTLALAYKKLEESEYSAWNNEFQKAKSSIRADREVMLKRVAEKMEKDLIMVGATAVEDKLQKRLDLDLGNYERFLEIKLTRDNNISTGMIYQVLDWLFWLRCLWLDIWTEIAATRFNFKGLTPWLHRLSSWNSGKTRVCINMLAIETKFLHKLYVACFT